MLHCLESLFLVYIVCVCVCVCISRANEESLEISYCHLRVNFINIFFLCVSIRLTMESEKVFLLLFFYSPSNLCENFKIFFFHISADKSYKIDKDNDFLKIVQVLIILMEVLKVFFILILFWLHADSWIKIFDFLTNWLEEKDSNFSFFLLNNIWAWPNVFSNISISARDRCNTEDKF
jgi:hypothetical protein